MNTKSRDPLRYIGSYAPELKAQVQAMIDDQSLGKYLEKKYAESHNITNDKSLRNYVMDLKNQYMRKSAPLSKIAFDGKIHVVNNALGLHSYVSRVQGGKLKSNNEIRIGSVFKKAPEAFLRMIVVHELAHLKEKDHDKAFYQLCQHMLPDYHQLEFDMRLYLAQLEIDPS
jgi:predicted metal-dependent hydrolase